MADDVILNKAASIERCIKRAQEEYTKAGPDFATDYSRQFEKNGRLPQYSCARLSGPAATYCGKYH